MFHEPVLHEVWNWSIWFIFWSPTNFFLFRIVGGNMCKKKMCWWHIFFLLFYLQWICHPRNKLSNQISCCIAVSSNEADKIFNKNEVMWQVWYVQWVLYLKVSHQRKLPKKGQQTHLNLLSHIMNFHKICRKYCEKMLHVLCLGDFTNPWRVYLLMWEVAFSFCIRVKHKVCLVACNRMEVSFPVTGVSLESVQTRLSDLTTCRFEHTAVPHNQDELPGSECNYC